MTHLKNNGIAIVVQTLFAGLFSAIILSNGHLDSPLFYLIAFIICFFGYLACGFFLLRPVRKGPFLSVLAVPVILFIIIILYLLVSGKGIWEIYALYIYTNPIASIYSCCPFSNFDYFSRATALLPNYIILSMFFSPLLMYLGMVLKKHFTKRHQPNDVTESIGFNGRTHLKNNGIALATHVLLTGAVALFLFSFSRTKLTISFNVFLLVVCIIFFIGYLACGFFLLRPVRRNAFYSVLSVSVALVIIYFYSFSPFYTGSGGLYFLTNPIASINSCLPLGLYLTINAEEFIVPNLLLLVEFVPVLTDIFRYGFKKMLHKVQSKKEKKCDIQAV